MQKVICPKCGEGIEELGHHQDAIAVFRFWLEYDLVQYELMETEVNDNDRNEWFCPDCNEVLFRSEEKAEAFLRGE